METTQVKQLKLNVTNIHSFLVRSNKQHKTLKARNDSLIKRQLNTAKQESEEKKLESPIGNSLREAKKSISATPSGSIFDKILGFGSLVLAGILVNGLPAIFKGIKELVDNIVNFITPIYAGFTLLKAVITGEPLDDPELSPEKKRFSDELKKVEKEVIKVQKMFGPVGFVLDPIRKFIDDTIKTFGGDDIVLATETRINEDTGEKEIIEGFLDKSTGDFIEKQFTAAEREKYESQRQRMLETPVSTPDEPDDDTFYEGEKRSQSSNFNKIYNLAVKHGAKFPEVVAAQAMHETGFMNPNLPSVFNSTGGTNPFGQTGDRGYGTIKREGSPDSGGWTLYPSLDVAVKDHIALWHRTSNHPQNYEAFDKAIDGIAAVAPVYSPDADPANIKLGYTADGYSSAMVKILKSNGFDPYKVKSNKLRKPQPRITPVPNNRDDQARVLNQKDPRGGDGSTTVAFQRVNNIQTVPYMMPVPTKSRSSSTSQPQLPSIWSA